MLQIFFYYQILFIKSSNNPEKNVSQFQHKY